MLKRIADRLALTKTERKVILFLSVTLLCGMGIRFYQKIVPSPPRFEYRVQDSTFASLNERTDEAAEKKEDTVDAGRAYHPEKLDINRATKDQLIDLPGIGETLAGRILERRTTDGKFTSIDELLEVKGITPKRLEKIRNLISIH
ncbi:MAG: helix-hairpin-helix domain-containing protein [Bacteroidota bacterium]